MKTTIELCKIQVAVALSGASPDTVRRQFDSGALKGVRVGSERIPGFAAVVLFAVEKRFGVDVRGFDRADAEKLAEAVRGASPERLTGGYAAAMAFCGLTDDSGRSAITSAISDRCVAEVKTSGRPHDKAR